MIFEGRRISCLRLQPQAAPAPFLQKPIVPGAQGARLCGRDTAALDNRDALLNPRPVVPSSPRGRQAPRRVCLASAQFLLQRRMFQPRSRRPSGSSRLPGPEWQDSIRRAHRALPRGSPHRLRPPPASVCCSPRVPASAHEPWFLRQTPLIF